VTSLVAWSATANSDEPPKAPVLTAAQRKRLKERDRLEQQVQKLGSEGKLVEMTTAAEAELAIEREVLGPASEDAIRSLNRLARLHGRRGDWAAAAKARRELLDRLVETLGRDHWRVTDARLALEGVEAAARMTVEQRRRLGEADQLQTALLELHRKGSDKEALPLARRAVAIRKELLGERHPDYTASLHNLAFLLFEQGDLAAARSLFERALEIDKEVLGERHPDYAVSLNSLAYLLAAQGDLVAATRFENQALDLTERRVVEALPTLTEREQVAFLNEARAYLSLVLELSAGRPVQDRDAYRRVLAWKGLVAEGAAARARAHTPQARVALDVLVPLRERLNRTYQARVPAERADEHARQVRDLATRVAALEAEVARAVGWKPEAPDPGRLANLLPEDSALIDILQYNHTAPPATGKHEFRVESRYAAFVVRRGRPITRVELGSVAKIAEPLNSWRARLRRGGDAEDLGRDVAQLVWAPLTPHLKGIRSVLVSPDGDLCFVPWGALPGDEPGSALLRQCAFGVISSARQLAALAAARDGSGPATGGLLVVGGVDYGAALGRPARTGEATVVPSRSIPTGGAALNFPALPGTAAEANTVAGLDRRAGAGAVETLGGSDATENRLSARMVGKRFLHLATHGYFAPPELKSALAPEEDRTSLRSWEGMSRAEVSGYFPGLLSGLVWAGANRPPTDPITGAVDIGAALMTAEVVSYLHDRGAAAIGVDVFVPETLDGYDRSPGLGGRAMGLAVAKAGVVVLSAGLGDSGRVVKPLTSWQTVDAFGLVEATEDGDHFVRRQQLAATAGGGTYDSMALALLDVAGRASAEGGALRIDGRPVPLDSDGCVRINFVGPPGTIRHVPFRAVLAAARNGGPHPADFAGATVIVGATARSLGDWHATPYANGAWALPWSRTAGLMAGPELQADIVATLIDGAYLTTPWQLTPLPWIVAVSALLGAAFARLNLCGGAMLAAAHHLGWRALALIAFRYGNWRLEVVAMLAAGSLAYSATFALRWRLLRRMFGAVKSEAIARALEVDPGQLRRKGEDRVLTVLFSDIRNFTAFSEAHSAREVVGLLNAYLAEVVPILEAHGATVDKYIGDGIMALFGAPDAQPDHATHAVRASVAMVERVHELAPRWAALGFPGMRIGVGVHTGPAVVGTIGSPRRLDYTAVGDTVNAAARIESENKPLGTEVLVSAATYAAVPESERAALGLAAEAVPVTVKGKGVTLALHRADVNGRMTQPAESAGTDRVATGSRTA